MGTNGRHLRGWDPGRQKVNAATDVLRHSESRGQCIDGAC